MEATFSKGRHQPPIETRENNTSSGQRWKKEGEERDQKRGQEGKARAGEEQESPSHGSFFLLRHMREGEKQSNIS